MDNRSNRDVLSAACDGDNAAWAELVSRFDRLVWSVVRGGSGSATFQTVAVSIPPREYSYT